MSAVGIYRSRIWWQRRFAFRLGVALPVAGIAAVVGSIAVFRWLLERVLP